MPPKKPKNPTSQKPKRQHPNAAPLTRNIKAGWLFYEGAGDVVHDCFGSLDLSVNAGGVWTVGTEGRAYNPSGTGSCQTADTDDLDVGNNEDFTIVIGMQNPTAGIGVGNHIAVVAKGTTASGATSGYWFGLEDQNFYFWVRYAAAGRGVYAASASSVDGGFHVWTCSRIGDNLRITRDGLLSWSASALSNGDLSNAATFYVGQDLGGHQYTEPIYFVYFYKPRAMRTDYARKIAANPYGAFVSPIGNNVVGPGLSPPPAPEPASTASGGTLVIGGGLFV